MSVHPAVGGKGSSLSGDLTKQGVSSVGAWSQRLARPRPAVRFAEAWRSGGARWTLPVPHADTAYPGTA